MKDSGQPVYMIGVAAELCNVHPQTLRQYERLKLVVPARAGAKNRLYSEKDIDRVRRIQRLTQGMGVNLAGVEIILRLLDDMDHMHSDFEKQFDEYVIGVEQRFQQQFANTKAPVRRDQPLFPVPRLKRRTKFDL